MYDNVSEKQRERINFFPNLLRNVSRYVCKLNVVKSQT